MIETPALGEIEITKWTQIALEVIKKNGDEKLLDAIIEHVSQHCPWIKNEKEKLTYAVECLLNKAYETWAKRGEFERVATAIPRPYPLHDRNRTNNVCQ